MCIRDSSWRVDTWFHGRTETLSEVNFLWDRIFYPGQFQPRDTIVLHLYGRFCNASTFAGEADMFEALADVKKNYSVDDNRILVRGFSTVSYTHLKLDGRFLVPKQIDEARRFDVGVGARNEFFRETMGLSLIHI